MLGNYNRFIANSEKFNDWHEKALREVCLFSKAAKYRNKPRKNPLSIRMSFYNKDNRRHDLDNMVSSVLDLLVDAGYLEDDHCKIVSSMLVVFRGVDRKYPRVEVTITELAE